MGVWGIGITSNDTFKDIYHDFYELYNSFDDIDSICNKLKIKYESVINDEDEANDYFFALAKAKWECGLLDKNLLHKIKTIVDSGSEVARWKRLGASKSDLINREQSLFVFYSKLFTHNIKLNKPKKVKLIHSIFHKGDCISIDLKNGKFGAAMALTEEINSKYGLNAIMLIDYYSSCKPDKTIFSNGFCFMSDIFGKTEPLILICQARAIKKSIYNFVYLWNHNIKIDIDKKRDKLPYGHWDHLGKLIIESLEGSVTSKLSISDFINS